MSRVKVNARGIHGMRNPSTGKNRVVRLLGLTVSLTVQLNYLAHFYLAFGDRDLLTGQFVADAVKGKQFLGYPGRIAGGILLHRHVDAYTDSHPQNLRLRSLIRQKLGLFTPVAIDLFFDHFLALQWEKWHREPLESFAAGCYASLTGHREHLPERMRVTLDYMSRYNWLAGYATKVGLQRSLEGLSGRVRGGHVLRIAPAVLDQYYPEIQQTFHIFFPEMIQSAKAKLDTFAAGLAQGDSISKESFQGQKP
jgi:acyl carrier protein phosphodiesterase